MACRLSEIVVESRDPTALARFWCDVLGYAVLDEDDGALEIGPADGFGGPAPTLVFIPSAAPRLGKSRVHVDVNATDRDQAAELERLLGLGAVRVDVGQGPDVTWSVLADPEGNEFCLLRSRLAPL